MAEAWYKSISQLKTLTVPTFILHGKQDIVPSWTAEEIHAAIAHSEIVLIDHSGHFPFIEQPSAFFKEVRTFLHKIESSRESLE